MPGRKRSSSSKVAGIELFGVSAVSTGWLFLLYSSLSNWTKLSKQEELVMQLSKQILW